MNNDQYHQDMEDYMWGTMGVNNGSAYNQAGLADKEAADSWKNDDTSYAATEQYHPEETAHKSASSNSESGWAVLVALAIGIITLVLVAPEEGEMEWFHFVAGGMGATLGYHFYKLILAVMVIMIAIYIYGESEANAASVKSADVDYSYQIVVTQKAKNGMRDSANPLSVSLMRKH